MAADSALLLGLVEEFVLGQQDRKAVDTATELKAGQFTILQLVEALGLHLTSSQPQTRARGVQLLSSVLQECHGDLTEREVEVLIVFYENRLKDHYVITPHVIQGLKALVSLKLSNLCHVKFHKDFREMSILSQLKGLGADFVFGFVQSVDGERDPRNLLLAFRIAGKIVREGYDLGKFTEELFEVTSCYFPIDFSPPPNDPHGITQEELVLALRAVLTGTPRFAEFLLPLIIEKLDSDVQSAKVDSLQTLTACASVYEHKELAQFLPGLWASLRREVFQTASERVESAGLAAVGSLTACLSRSVLNSDSEDSLNVFLELVLKDCQHHLCEPDLKLVWPSAKLLQATSTASYRASHRVAAAVLPSLIEQYNSRTQVSHTIQLGRSIIVNVDESVLLDFRQSLCSVVFSALSESNADLQITSMRVLTALGQQTGDAPNLSTPLPMNVEVPQMDRLLLELEELSCTSDHPLSYTSAAKCYAGLVNKSPAGEMLKRISTELDSASSPVRTQAFTLLLWVSKALLLRYHPLSTALTDKLFSLLSDPELGSLAADGFSLLMSDSQDVLNRGSHADVRIMYRQRFFTENSAKLVEGFNAAVQEKKSGYLKALSHIVNNLPRQVQLTELPALLPLLLEALSCPDQGVQVSTLSCLQPVLLDPPSTLITQLEVCLTSSSQKVRIASLRCIHALSRFPEHEVRLWVLRALAAPLDDHKRVVRSEAAVARNEWFLLGSPGGR
uniref:MMS19 nucleotide excision repair protein n=1 Tax=Salmo trutta TaxID=8032 RepID=A0A673Y7J6_SALTR